MRRLLILLLTNAMTASAHDAHGRANAPRYALWLKSPVPRGAEQVAAGQHRFEELCATCHGADGRARTPSAAKLRVRPTDLTNYLMDSMREGEIFGVVTNGIGDRMPGFEKQLSETERWETVQYVRELRSRQRAAEKAQLGPYEWRLPPGFPFPNVPVSNRMTTEKVELGRYLFYDKRLSLNEKQACATCHRQERAFSDGRGQGLGSTGERHPRGPMSLVNVAYSPALTWANPNMRTLEEQALVPLFGEDPVELGMSGQEDLLIGRLKAVTVYQRLFAAAFPGEADPFTLGNITKAIASFERTILSGESPYDRYRVGDDPDAISPSAKRGEALFFSERLECFHCHGGFNFTGTVDYLDKGFPEVEFHNTGLYNLSGKFTYPGANLGLYVFTQQEEDVGKFKAPTLRNIAVTAPYMHDGSVKTLGAVIDHYSAGGRRIEKGPNAGVGAENPNKSEFVKGFNLTSQEKADLIEFLSSLTDETLLTDARLSNPWLSPISRRRKPKTHYFLRGTVVEVSAEEGVVSMDHDAIPGLMKETKAPDSMVFLVQDREALRAVKPGQTITALVRRQGRDYVLSNVAPARREAVDKRRKYQ